MLTDIDGSFDIQDLGDPTRLLGIKITCSRELGTIHISQPSFIDTIAHHLNITPGRPITSPMDLSIELHSSSDSDDTINIPYASAVGSINYCAVSTHPDIAYIVNKCTQFSSRPNLMHWDAVKHIICYRLHTREHGIL